jgi:hypothetical protein
MATKDQQSFEGGEQGRTFDADKVGRFGAQIGWLGSHVMTIF